MAKRIGPSFLSEFLAAGLGGAPVAWGTDSDTITGRELLSPAQSAALDAVIAAHDATMPAPPPPKEVTVGMLFDAATPAETATMWTNRPRDVARLLARPDPVVPVSNAKVAKLAQLIGTTPEDWFARVP